LDYNLKDFKILKFFLKFLFFSRCKVNFIENKIIKKNKIIMERKSSKSKSPVFSTSIVDENKKLIDYCTLTVHKEGDQVDFSVITANGSALSGKNFYEEEEQWEEVLKIIKKSPPITLLQDGSAKIKKLGIKLSAINLNETQKLAYKVVGLEREIQSLRETLRNQSLWNSINKIKIGSVFSFKDEVCLDLPNKEIPENTTEILVDVYTHLSSEDKLESEEFELKVFTKGKDGETYYKLVRASQNIWLPYNFQNPVVYVQSIDSRSFKNSESGTHLSLIGYRNFNL